MFRQREEKGRKLESKAMLEAILSMVIQKIWEPTFLGMVKHPFSLVCAKIQVNMVKDSYLQHPFPGLLLHCVMFQQREEKGRKLESKAMFEAILSMVIRKIWEPTFLCMVKHPFSLVCAKILVNMVLDSYLQHSFPTPSPLCYVPAKRRKGKETGEQGYVGSYFKYGNPKDLRANLSGHG